MSLETYLNDALLDEKAIVEELLNIDNKICDTLLNYEQLVGLLKNSKNFSQSITETVNVITDGNPEMVYRSLINYGKYINKIHVDRTFLGINKWLVERTNDYYKELGINTYINIDEGSSYLNYDDKTVVIIGEEEFAEGISNLFSKTEIIKIII